jgi:riboflavin kinase/FMN adenylyltransferase
MAVVATGFFDGVHLGHRLVIDTLLSEAGRRGEQSVVVSFWPHPRAVLQSGADKLRYLTPRSEKDAVLRGLGVDCVETVPFTREFAAMPAMQYIRMLREQFGCTELVLGYDTRFGREQAGPYEIASMATEMGMEAVVTSPVCIGESPVSSSRIRNALSVGEVEEAAGLLGRPYELHGVVVAGNRLGRTIGFPTANMKLYEPLMLIPQNGVYATRVLVQGKCYDGMTNIGTRPTVSERDALTIETNIFGFDEMIYGLDITVGFVARIRDERKFASLSELQLQLTDDADSCKRIFNCQMT